MHSYSESWPPMYTWQYVVAIFVMAIYVLAIYVMAKYIIRHKVEEKNYIYPTPSLSLLLDGDKDNEWRLLGNLQQMIQVLTSVILC